MINNKSVITNFEMPGAKPHYNPDKDVKVQHIFLDLVVDFEDQILYGIASLKTFAKRSNLKKLTLDAAEMDISLVKVNGQEVEYNYDSKKLDILLKNPTTQGQEISLEINYLTRKPRKGLHFVVPTKEYPNKPVQIWTQGESESSRYWFPCFDNPTQIHTSEIRVALPEEFTLVSNGKEITGENTQADNIAKIVGDVTKNKTFSGFKTVHWNQDLPHPTYLMCMTAGDFVEIKDFYEGLPVNYYTASSRAQYLQESAQKTPKMIQAYEKIFGVKYPWSKYSQIWVADFIWGGMENTSSTINADRALVDARASVDYTFGEKLIAHELGHQWFGDLVIIDHWANLWVKEGGATYSEALWWESEYGKEEFDYYRLQEHWQTYFSEQYLRNLTTNIYENVEHLYDKSHAYSKAGTIYHMIRTELGDDDFTRSLKTFLEDNRHKNVNGNDLLRAITKATGRNLLPLFDQYLHSSGHPDLKVSYSWDQESQLATLRVKQKQVKSNTDFQNLFNLELPLNFGYLEESEKIKTKQFKIKLDQPEQVFYYNLDKKPDFVSFDAGNNYLKAIELDYDPQMLANQLKYDQDVISKAFAAKYLGKTGTLKALDLLREAYDKEEFWGVRVEIVKAISTIRIKETYDNLKSFLSDTDSRIRVEALNGLAKIKTEKNFTLLQSVEKEGDKSYFVEAEVYSSLAEVAKSLGQKHEQKVIKICRKALKEKEGWNEVVRSGVIKGLAKLNSNQEALDLILNFAKVGVVEYLRNNTLRYLGIASKNQPKDTVNKILDVLEQAAGSDLISTEMAIVTALKSIPDQRSMQILEYIRNHTIFGRTERYVSEAIEILGKKLEPQDSIEELRKKIQKLEDENIKFKDQIQKLEVKK